MSNENVSFDELPRLDRRAALKWIAAASAALAVIPGDLLRAQPNIVAYVSAGGYGKDPLLNKIYASGDLWPLTLNEAQRRTAAALCDLIIPAEQGVPSASEVHVVDFIDEWVSAPYPGYKKDRPLILEGLKWMDAEAQKRFSKDFAKLTVDRQSSIADDICFQQDAKEPFRRAAHFFDRFRYLTCGGFYSTPEGMADIGYIGNRPSLHFDGPPQEVIEQLLKT